MTNEMNPKSGKEASGVSTSIMDDIKRIQNRNVTPEPATVQEPALTTGQQEQEESARPSQESGETQEAKKNRPRKRSQTPSFEDFIENLKIFDAGTSTLNVVIPKHINSGALLLSKQIGVDKRDFVIAALLEFMKNVYNNEDAKKQIENLIDK